MDPCAAVVESTAWVVGHATSVKIDPATLDAFVSELDAQCSGGLPAWDDGGWHFGDDASTGGPLTAQYVLVLDALNWCFWPSETAMEYDTLASGLTRALRADPSAFSADALQALTPDVLRSWFAPHHLPGAEERVRKLREVGAVLAGSFGGLAANFVAAAGGSAIALVRLVAAHFPGFRDECVYVAARETRQVFLYKRAQIFVADVWAAYGRCTGRPDLGDTSASIPPALAPYAFADIGALTCFADYRIPQLLAARGVLVYSPTLAAAVLAREEIPAGSAPEVEVRAATVQAVLRLQARLSEVRRARDGEGANRAPLNVEVDWALWNWGERSLAELPPHHRTRTVFY